MSDYTKYEKNIEDWQARGKHLTDTAVAEKREMTDSEVREHEALYGKIAATRQVIEDLKEEELEKLRNVIEAHEPPKVRDKRSDSQFFRSMRHGEEHDLWTPEQRSWTTSGTTAASGMLTEEWYSEVFKYLFEASIARQSGIRVITTSTTTSLPVMSAYGSATAVPLATMTAYTQDDPTVTKVQLGAYKFVKRVDVSEELLEDSDYNLAGLIAEAAGIAFGLAENRYGIGASGTGSATDMTPSGLFAKAGDASGTAGSGITVAQLMDFYYTLGRQFRSGAVWLMNDATVGYIARLRTSAASADQILFWNDPVGGEPAKLYGHPIYTTSHIPTWTASATKIIALANLGQAVCLGERGPLNVKRMQLNEYSDTFAMSKRIDQKYVQASACQIFITGSA